MTDSGFRSRATDIAPRGRIIVLLSLLPIVFALGRCSGPVSTLVAESGPDRPVPAPMPKLVRYDDGPVSCWVALDAHDAPVAVTCMPIATPGPTHAQPAPPQGLYAQVTP